MQSFSTDRLTVECHLSFDWESKSTSDVIVDSDKVS